MPNKYDGEVRAVTLIFEFVAEEMAGLLKRLIQEDMSSENPTGLGENHNGSQTLSEMVDEMEMLIKAKSNE